MKEMTGAGLFSVAKVAAGAFVLASVLALGCSATSSAAERRRPEPIVTAAYRLIALRYAASNCVVLVDVSGSGVDNPDNYSWLLSRLQEVAADQWSLAPMARVNVVLYDEQIFQLGPYGPEDRERIATDVGATVRSGRWGNPVPALQAAARSAGLSCAILVTDGSVDAPPALNAAEFAAGLSSAVGELAARRVPIVVVALHDDSGGLWSAAAGQTGGAYLVDPGAGVLLNAITAASSSATLPPTPATTTSPIPHPAPSTPSPAPIPDASSGGGGHGSSVNAGVVATAVAVATLALVVFIVLTARRRRPYLSGFIEVQTKTKEVDHGD